MRFGLPRAPALAHRLYRNTSGCLMLGRHRKALALLGRLFKSGAVEKTYWVVVEGTPAADEGVIELPLGRLYVTRGWWMKHDPQGGQPAVTKWRVMGRAGPLPGSASNRGPGVRTSCGSIARRWAGPFWAIRFTAPRRARAARPCICNAGEIVVPLYKNRAPIRVRAPAPEHMRAALAECGWKGEPQARAAE